MCTSVTIDASNAENLHVVGNGDGVGHAVLPVGGRNGNADISHVAIVRRSGQHARAAVY